MSGFEKFQLTVVFIGIMWLIISMLLLSGGSDDEMAQVPSKVIVEALVSNVRDLQGKLNRTKKYLAGVEARKLRLKEQQARDREYAERLKAVSRIVVRRMKVCERPDALDSELANLFVAIDALEEEMSK